MQYYQIIAANYGEGSYNTGLYSQDTTTSGSSTTSNGSSSGGSPLATTGFEIALAVTVASVIIVTAVLIRFIKRPKSAPKETTAD